MILIGRKRLSEFMRRHADARKWIEAWVGEVELAAWSNPRELKRRYPQASILENNIVIFDVKGNKYRLETQVAYHAGIVVVRRIGTHADYERWPRRGEGYGHSKN